MLSLDRVRYSKRFIFAISLVALLSWLVWANPSIALADSPGDPLASQQCLVCHAASNLKMKLASGEILSATIDPQTFQQSVHGQVLQCTACHAEMTGYPHPARSLARPSARDKAFLIRSYTACGSCHAKELEAFLGSAHAQALSAGKTDAAICSDCHGAHDITQADPSQVGLALVPSVYSCGKCHTKEFEDYKLSIHGKDLIERNDPKVAACVDCHSAHSMAKAKDNPDFRRQSLAICVSCHADQKLMTQYGLSTRILSTYVADFHGATAQLYPSQLGQAPEQAMCYDCHSNHNIASTVAADGLTEANLLAACQKCHKDASTNFPAAWVGHHDPTPNYEPLVFWVRTIYNVLISGMVLMLVGHITLDIGRMFLNTLRRGGQSHE
jgi:predicted CXXCH cytochrome family protein